MSTGLQTQIAKGATRTADPIFWREDDMHELVALGALPQQNHAERISHRRGKRRRHAGQGPGGAPVRSLPEHDHKGAAESHGDRRKHPPVHPLAQERSPKSATNIGDRNDSTRVSSQRELPEGVKEAQGGGTPTSERTRLALMVSLLGQPGRRTVTTRRRHQEPNANRRNVTWKIG